MAHAHRLPPPLRSFLAILSISVAVCLVIEATCFALHLGYPYDWPLMFHHPSFMDFTWYVDRFRDLHTSAFFDGLYPVMYPAPLVVSYSIFYAFQPIALPVFLLFILASVSTFAIAAIRALTTSGLKRYSAIFLVGSTCLLAYPLWFEVKQANMEVVVWVVLTAGLVAAYRQHSWTAALLFGLAASMKFYPLIYLGLLLSSKHYRQCLFGCLVAAATILLSLWFVGPTIPIAWRGMQTGLALFRSEFMLPVRPGEIGFDHSIFAILKAVLAITRRLGFTPLLSTHFRSVMLNEYLSVAVIAGIALYSFRIRHLPWINQLICLSVATILLPPTSFDYTLLHLYAPWLLLSMLAVTVAQKDQILPGLHAVMVCLALCLAPLGEFILFHERFGGQLRALLLVALFTIGLLFPFNLDAAAGKTVKSATIS